jgi:hypothetical protein
MFKLKNIVSTKKIETNFDFYVPVNIAFGYRYPGDEGSHCWGIYGSDDKSLFEIAIGEITGELKYITLVLSPKVHVGKSPISQKSLVANTEGLPVFETKEWGRDDYHTRETLDFNVYLDQNDVYIVLLANKVEKIVTNERVIFYFDKDNRLCSIQIKDMSVDEKALLEESLMATKAL